MQLLKYKDKLVYVGKEDYQLENAKVIRYNDKRFLFIGTPLSVFGISFLYASLETCNKVPGVLEKTICCFFGMLSFIGLVAGLYTLDKYLQSLDTRKIVERAIKYINEGNNVIIKCEGEKCLEIIKALIERGFEEIKC